MLILRLGNPNIAKISHQNNFGSGFIYQYQGENYIISTAHILDNYRANSDELKVTLFEQESGVVVDYTYARLVVVDDIRDVMILKFAASSSDDLFAKIQPMEFASTDKIAQDQDSQEFLVAGVNRDITNTLNRLPVTITNFSARSPSIHIFKRNFEFFGAEAGFSGGPIIDHDGQVWGMVMQYTLQQVNSENGGATSTMMLPTRHGLALPGNELEQFVIDSLEIYLEKVEERDHDWIYDGGWAPNIKYRRNKGTIEYKGLTLGYREVDLNGGPSYGYRYAGVEDLQHKAGYQIEVKRLAPDFNDKTELGINFLARGGVIRENDNKYHQKFGVTLQTYRWFEGEKMTWGGSWVKHAPIKKNRIQRYSLIGAIAVLTDREATFKDADSYMHGFTVLYHTAEFTKRKKKRYVNGKLVNERIDYLDRDGIRIYNIQSIRDILDAFKYAKEQGVHDRDIIIVPEVTDFVTLALGFFSAKINYEHSVKPLNSVQMIPGFNYGISMGRTYHLNPHYPSKVYLEIYKMFMRKFRQSGIKVRMVGQDDKPVVNKCSILSLLPIHHAFHNQFLKGDSSSLKLKKLVLKQANWEEYKKDSGKLFYDKESDTATLLFHYGFEHDGKYHNVYDENEMKQHDPYQIGTIHCDPTPVRASQRAADRIVQYSNGTLKGNINDGGFSLFRIFGF